MAKHAVYQFYAELKNYEPKIWRVFEINGEKTVAELAYVVMILFEMQANHLFSIKQNNKELLKKELQKEFNEEQLENFFKKHGDSDLFKTIRYELASEYVTLSEDEIFVEANNITLNQLTRNEGFKLDLEYDFGDSWEVELILKKYEVKEFSLRDIPKVKEGEGYGIVEDVGGVIGLEQLAKTLKKRTGKEYEEVTSWLDSTTLNLEEFDKEDMNFRVKKIIRIYKDIYENRYPPTEKSVALLLRKYKGKGSNGY